MSVGLCWKAVLFFLAYPHSLSLWSLWSHISFPSSSLKRRQNGAGNERGRWENWERFPGERKGGWCVILLIFLFPFHSSSSVVCLDCPSLSRLLPSLYHPSLSILGLGHPPSPLSLLFLSQCFFSSHLWHNLGSKPFVHSVSPSSWLLSWVIILFFCKEIKIMSPKVLFCPQPKHIQQVYSHMEHTARPLRTCKIVFSTSRYFYSFTHASVIKPTCCSACISRAVSAGFRHNYTPPDLESCKIPKKQTFVFVHRVERALTKPGLERACRATELLLL